MSDSILLFSRYDDATVINIFVEFLKISRISRSTCMIAVHLTVLYQQGPRRQVTDAPSSQPTTLEVPVPRDNFTIGRPRRRKHYRVQRPKSRPVTQSNLSSRLSAFPTTLLTYLEENSACLARMCEQTRDREVESQASGRASLLSSTNCRG